MKAVLMLAAMAAASMLTGTAASAQTTPADSAAAATAATAATPGDSSSTTSGGSRPRRSGSLLMADEIVAARESNLYNVIHRLRARWLRDRPGEEHDIMGKVEIQVYRNGVLQGTVDVLKEIAPTDVASVQWVEPMAARSRFGPRGSHGVIVVVDRH